MKAFWLTSLIATQVAADYSVDYCNAVESTMTSLLENGPQNPCLLFTEGIEDDPWGANGDQITATCAQSTPAYAWKALDGVSTEVTIRTLVQVAGWRHSIEGRDTSDEAFFNFAIVDTQPTESFIQSNDATLDWAYKENSGDGVFDLTRLSDISS